MDVSVHTKNYDHRCSFFYPLHGCVSTHNECSKCALSQERRFAQTIVQQQQSVAEKWKINWTDICKLILGAADFQNIRSLWRVHCCLIASVVSTSIFQRLYVKKEGAAIHAGMEGVVFHCDLKLRSISAYDRASVIKSLSERWDIYLTEICWWIYRSLWDNSRDCTLFSSNTKSLFTSTKRIIRRHINPHFMIMRLREERAVVTSRAWNVWRNTHTWMLNWIIRIW